MIIQCGNCGYLKSVKHKGTIEEIELDIHKTIHEGWRYSSSHDTYVCPKCASGNNHDKFYEMCAGKIRKSNETVSYTHLLCDIARFINEII